MSQDQRRLSDPERPWTDPQMPCVYCGRLIQRKSQRCPECKTSYSKAVRRASREVEGPWFTLEPRNPSNRGVDFRTVLKMIEMGRLKRDSIVRGPPTHQDWMFAAEVPGLSKHLGLCPHCFSTARGDQEFCDACHRSLDERPARLRPGISEPGKESRFPERDALERDLAEALRAHDMARVATEAAPQHEEPSHVEEILHHERPSVERSAVAAAPRRHPPRHKGEQESRRAKPHIVALLTIVTVIPLGLLMVSLPVERMFGDPAEDGSLAERVRSNRHAFLRTIQVPWAPGEAVEPELDEALRRRIREAEAFERAERTDEALALYRSVLAEDPPTEIARDLQGRIDALRQAERAELQQRRVASEYRQAENDFRAGRLDEALAQLGRLTLSDRNVAQEAGLDVSALEGRIREAIKQREIDQARDEVRREVQARLDDAQRRMSQQKYQEAIDIYTAIGNKYSAEDLPEGTDLAALTREARRRLRRAEPAPEPEPEPAIDQQEIKAKRLWQEALDLEKRQKFAEAYAKCQELQKMPEKYHPRGLKAKATALEKLKFFFEG